jgi:hypothetical protein
MKRYTPQFLREKLAMIMGYEADEVRLGLLVERRIRRKTKLNGEMTGE